MNHIPEIRSVNARCPSCGVRFGYVVENDKVTCPMCGFAQPLPIIKIDGQEYLCIPCGMDFTIPEGRDIVCPRCEMPAVWQPEET